MGSPVNSDKPKAERRLRGRGADKREITGTRRRPASRTTTSVPGVCTKTVDKSCWCGSMRSLGDEERRAMHREAASKRAAVED